MSTPIGSGFRGVEGRLGYLLRQAHQAMHAAIEREVQRFGITAPQFSLLSALRHEPDVSVTALAQNSMITQQTTSAIVRTLERKGLVERRSHPGDRRADRLRLTPRGRTVLGEADAEVLRLEELTVAGLEPGQREAAAAWLVACAETFGQDRAARRRAPR